MKLMASGVAHWRPDACVGQFRLPGCEADLGLADMTPEEKADAFEAFQNGEIRVLVSKPSIAGMGLNWQHCHNVAFVGLSYSFEDFYQALRRSYRFGQTKPVNAYIVQAATEGAILKAVEVKTKMDVQRHRGTPLRRGRWFCGHDGR